MSNKYPFLTTLFGLQYVFTGVLGFVLPTKEWYEVAFRLIFILLGASIILTYNTLEYNVRIQGVAWVFLVFWVLFGYLLILKLPQDAVTRVHLFYMHFWFAWIFGQRWLINQLRRS